MVSKKFGKKESKTVGRCRNKWNKKGIMDDAVDFIFTVLICFVLLLFIGVIVKGGIDAKNKQSLELAERVVKVDDYLIEKRAGLEEGKKIDREAVTTEIASLRKLGHLPAPREVRI